MANLLCPPDNGDHKTNQNPREGEKAMTNSNRDGMNPLIEQTLSEHPESVFVLWETGNLCREAGDPDTALRCLNTAVELAQRESLSLGIQCKLWVSLGMLLRQMKHIDAADKRLRRAVETAETQNLSTATKLLAYNAWRVFLSENDRHQEAAAVAAKARELLRTPQAPKPQYRTTTPTVGAGIPSVKAAKFEGRMEAGDAENKACALSNAHETTAREPTPPSSSPEPLRRGDDRGIKTPQPQESHTVAWVRADSAWDCSTPDRCTRVAAELIRVRDQVLAELVRRSRALSEADIEDCVDTACWDVFQIMKERPTELDPRPEYLPYHLRALARHRIADLLKRRGRRLCPMCRGLRFDGAERRCSHCSDGRIGPQTVALADELLASTNVEQLEEVRNSTLDSLLPFVFAPATWEALDDRTRQALTILKKALTVRERSVWWVSATSSTTSDTFLAAQFGVTESEIRVVRQRAKRKVARAVGAWEESPSLLIAEMADTNEAPAMVGTTGTRVPVSIADSPRVESPPNPPRDFDPWVTLGTIVADQPDPLRFRVSDLQSHLFIAGGSGNGKSKMIEMLCRQLIALGYGLTLIDPHGDTANSVARWCAIHGTAPQQIHYLKPGAEQSFRIDPFAGAPKNCSLHEYEAWLSSACDRVISAFLRNFSAADHEHMKRLKRWAKNIFFVCGYDVNGEHVGLAKALVLTDPENPEFERIIERVRPYACRTDSGREVMLDFDKLRDTKGARTRELRVESTINMLKEVLGPVMRLVFGQHAPPISPRDIILNRGIQLVNVAKSDAFSREQANAIGGLVVSGIISAAQQTAGSTSKADCVPHFLIIDEAENFIGENLLAAIGEMRKFKLSLCFATQDLSRMHKSDQDLIPKLLSQCATQITFHQSSLDDIEFLGKSFAYGGLDFTPLLDKQILHDSDDYVLLSNETVRRSMRVIHPTSLTESLARSRAWGRTESEGINESVSLAHSTTHAEGRTTNRTAMQSQGSSIPESEVVSQLRRAGTPSESAGATTGATTSRPRSVARTESTSQAHAVARGQSVSDSTSETTSHGVSVAPLARHRDELVETGNLNRSVADQLAEVMTLLASLPDRFVLVKVKSVGRPFLLRVHDVPDLDEDRLGGKPAFVPRCGAWREHELTTFQDRVFAAHAGILPTTAESGASKNAKEQAAVNVTKAYSDSLLKMTTFTLDSVSDHGNYLNVDAICTRTVTARGVTTTKYAVRFVVTIQTPPRGQTVGQMVVTSVTSQIIK